MLFAFTILAGVSSLYRAEPSGGAYELITWTTLGFGYFVTLLFAWFLPKSENLPRFAWGQTTIDIILAAVVVQLTGGVDSGFVFLYLVALLGAATMGSREQTWAATGACALIYLTLTVLQGTGVFTPVTFSGEPRALPLLELAFTSARTLAAMVGIGILSAYLNVQLWSSVQQVGSLRALNENIVRSLTSGLLTVDADGRLLGSNPTARELLAIEGELRGMPIDEVVPGVADHLEDSGGPTNRFELELRRSDGRSLHLGLNCAPLLDNDGRFIGHVVHFQDVTELHDLARKARRNERLVAVGSLAASVAHEVRNPLAAISGSAELLTSAVNDPDDQKLLDVIIRETNRLEKTVSDLLSFTRPQTPERVALDVTQAIRENAEAFRADPANAAIQVGITASGKIVAELDPGQFSQILWNLMRNAAEAMSLAGRIEVRASREDDLLVVEIEDEGPGIPEEDLDRVLEPFYSTKDKGSGFGLALVQRIVQDHEGEITVRSRPGEGATFTVRLPLRQRKQAPARGPSSSALR
jgi:two-component system sensor histidine kinase PilS (NtrC family)